MSDNRVPGAQSSQSPKWYVQPSHDGWSLNEYRPGESDGHIASFGPADEDKARRAAMCHNLHEDMVAVCQLLDSIDSCAGYSIGDADLSKFWQAQEQARSILGQLKKEEGK